MIRQALRITSVWSYARPSCYFPSLSLLKENIMTTQKLLQQKRQLDVNSDSFMGIPENTYFQHHNGKFQHHSLTHTHPSPPFFSVFPYHRSYSQKLADANLEKKIIMLTVFGLNKPLIFKTIYKYVLCNTVFLDQLSGCNTILKHQTDLSHSFNVTQYCKSVLPPQLS